jgi:hypothetical protein
LCNVVVFCLFIGCTQIYIYIYIIPLKAIFSLSLFLPLFANIPLHYTHLYIIIIAYHMDTLEAKVVILGKTGSQT